MVKRLLIFALLAFPAFSQQLSNGVYYPPPTPMTIPIYGSIGGGTTGASSPSVLALASIPPGSTAVGIFNFGGSAVTSVTIGDGTGSCGLTGSDSAIIEPVYANATNFRDYVYIIANTQNTTANITACWTGSASYSYPTAVLLFGTLSLDTGATGGGYIHNQSTTAGTTYSVSGMTTTAGNDILVCIQSNGANGPITPGTDGQGNTYTQQQENAYVSSILTVQETGNNTYGCSMTSGTSSKWNVHLLAFEPTATTGTPPNFASNGRNYVQAQGGNGKVYSAPRSATCLVDFNAGTNGVAPTAATAFNGVRGGAACFGDNTHVSVAALGPNMLYTNAQQPVLLGYPAIIAAAGYPGSGGFGIGGVTTTSTTSIGELDFTNITTSTSMALGFSVYEDCPGQSGLDCGALGGSSGSGGYIVPHFLQHGSSAAQTVFMENHAGETPIYNPIPTATVLRINTQQDSSGNNYMVVCDAHNHMLYNWVAPADGVGNGIRAGISGEQPAVANYHYYFWNYVPVANGTININGPCF